MSNSFEIGDEVFAKVPLRNDGSYPDPKLRTGSVLVERGLRGHVTSLGTFLQDRVVYAVSFANGRIVGCLEHELQVDELESMEKEG